MNERSQREREIYNKGIANEWKEYSSRFGHANLGYEPDQYRKLFDLHMAGAKSKDVLEIGSTAWENLDLVNNSPRNVTCINISEKFLQKGKDLYNELNPSTNIDFVLMDANKLEFADNSFDVVFGIGILHHLDFETAIKEIHRVLKNGGFCCFSEPLIGNPIGKIVRKRTPEVRTPDEKPLGKQEITVLNNYFEVDYLFRQLFYVPAGVISAKLTKTPYNPLMKSSYLLDNFLGKYGPHWFKLLYRYVYFIAKCNKPA